MAASRTPLPGLSAGERMAAEPRRPVLAAVRRWLFAIAALVFLMALVGSATRLTDSGLSITEWRPILGAVPPLSDADWQVAFDNYKAIPEYKIVNDGMSLAAFKVIYWWEWSHRFLGRLIGVAFLLPFLIFLARGWVRGRLALQCIGLFGLGALQGLVGWMMVRSGLVDRVDVSQYRLALHLGLAAVIFAGALWIATGLEKRIEPPEHHRWLRLSAAGIVAAVLAQILLGALVAGTDAGLAHNTWPLMDGALVPTGLLVIEPWYRNPFENVMTIQFDHRFAAYLVLALALTYRLAVRRSGVGGRTCRLAGLLLATTLVQIGLGIGTLLAMVPIGLALAHQAGAFLLLGIAVLCLDAVSRRGRASA